MAGNHLPTMYPQDLFIPDAPLDYWSQYVSAKSSKRGDPHQTPMPGSVSLQKYQTRRNPMNESTAELKARKASLAVELSEIRRQLARRKNIPLTTEALKESRAYAFNANSPMNMVVKSCADSLTRYGFAW